MEVEPDNNAERRDPSINRPVQQRTTLEIDSINRPDICFMTIGKVRHSFTCPKAVELTNFAQSIEQLVVLCRCIELHILPGPEYLIVLESLNGGSWLLVRSTSRQPENALCVVIGKSFQIGRWIVCQGSITPCLGTGVYWNEYLSQIDRYKGFRMRTTRGTGQEQKQENRQLDSPIKDIHADRLAAQKTRGAKIEHLQDESRL